MDMFLSYDAQPIVRSRVIRRYPRWAALFAALLWIVLPAQAQLIAYPPNTLGQTIIFTDYGGNGEYQVIGTYNKGVYRSDPLALGKKRWYESNTCAVVDCGLPTNYVVNDMELLTGVDNDPPDPDVPDGRILMGIEGYHGLWYSDDGGETWTQQAPESFDELPPNAVRAITQSEVNPGFVYLSADDGYTYFSQDGGVTYIYNGQLPGGSSQVPWSLQAHPTEANWLFAGTFGYGVWRSADNGGIWVPMFDNEALQIETAGHVFDLKFDPNFPNMLYAATGQGVWRFEDVTNDTKQWEPVETEFKSFLLVDGVTEVKYTRPEARSIDFDVNGDMYVATWGFGILRLTDTDGNLPLSVLDVPEQIQLRNGLVSTVAIGGGGTELFATSDTGFLQLNLGSSTAAEDDVEVPSGYALSQNFPNPFNPTTSISFEVPVSGKVELAVFDLFGRKVASLVDGVRSAGQHSVTFNAANLASGVYMYRLQAGDQTLTRTLTLVK